MSFKRVLNCYICGGYVESSFKQAKCIKCESEEKHQKEDKEMKKPNLQQYFKECQARGIFDHEIRATDNGENVLFYIHPKNVDGETLDFSVKGNELTQRHISQEDDIRKILGDIIDGLPLERLKELANKFGLNYQ